VDDHHSVEDVGIALGSALKEALAEKRGVRRYGSMLLPMDEALVLCALDLSGRACLRYGLEIPTEKVGTFDTELAHEFFAGLARDAGITLHVREIAGENAHHVLECAFKAVARALRQAVSPDPRVSGIPSTKGSL
jgi:imidazoleglycerol-phosphate dehydratase